MKTILFSLLSLLFLHAYGQQQVPQYLRYFMQTTPSPANEILYPHTFPDCVVVGIVRTEFYPFVK